MRRRCLFLCSAVLCLVSFSSAYAGEPRALHKSAQLIVVTTPGWGADYGALQRFERSNGHWKAVGDSIPVVMGKTGLGWGAGIASGDLTSLHVANDPVKREGDRRSPAGLFRLSSSFGYAAQAQAGWKMPYVSLTPSIECVDDGRSRFYNRVVDRSRVSPDWNSSERMAEEKPYYVWGLVVDHNTAPATPGVGSCIFLHFWGSPNHGTVGCTAMSREAIEGVLGWLDPRAKPLLLQLPLPQYQKIQKHWKLPQPTQELP